MRAMFSSSLRLIACATLLCLLPACSTVPRAESGAAVELQKTGLAQAELLLRQARRLDDDEVAVAAVFRLRAAEIAWGELSGRTDSRRAGETTLGLRSRAASTR